MDRQAADKVIIAAMTNIHYFLGFTLFDLYFAECFLSLPWIFIFIYCPNIHFDLGQEGGRYNEKEVREMEEVEDSGRYGQICRRGTSCALLNLNSVSHAMTKALPLSHSPSI